MVGLAAAEVDAATLLYGTPVPGYAAPQDTTPPASRPVVVLASILNEAAPLDGPEVPLSPALRAEIRRVEEIGAPDVGDAAMVRGLIGWTLLFGALNFELFGRINNVIDERTEWFDVQMLTILDFVGL